MSNAVDSETMTKLDGSNKRAKTSHLSAPAVDALTSLLTSAHWRSLVYPYLTVPELVCSRGVSKQWHQLFSQASCGSAGWSWNVTELQLKRLAQRTGLMQRISLQLLERLGCQRNIMMSLPQLCEMEVGDYSVTVEEDSELMTHLAECRDLPLKKLQLSDNCSMSAAVLRACPHLTHLDDFAECGSTHVLSAWLEYAPPKLQHFGWLRGTHQPGQLPQIAMRCSTLETVCIDMIPFSGWDNEQEVYTLLASCHNLVTLNVEFGTYKTELIDILCTLPRLRCLNLSAPSLEMQFLDRIPELRESMISRLPEEQQREQRKDSHQHIEINITDIFFSEERLPQVADKWWCSLVRAKPYCTKLDCATQEFDDFLLAIFNDSRTNHSTGVATINDASLAEHHDALVAYIKLDTALHKVTLLRGDQMSDQHLHAALSHMTQLCNLHLKCRSPAKVYQALEASAALTLVSDLNIQWPAPQGNDNPLAECLQLIQACSALKQLHFKASVSEWVRVSLSDLLEKTAHVPVIHLSCSNSQSCAVQRSAVVSMLLALPNLATVNDSQTMTLLQANRIRAISGLRPVQFS